MKKSTIYFLLLLFCLSSWAQSSDNISYQAVVRNSENELVTDQTIFVKISILQGSSNGSVIYTETHSPSTNINGLMTLFIGNGDASVGSFAAIDWSAGPYFVQTNIDPEGASNFSITSTSQLLSVPYALHAKTAENLTSTYDSDSTNEIQDLSFIDNNLTITGNGSATSVDLSGYLDNTDTQTLSLSGTDLSISDGNSVDLSEISSETTYEIGDRSLGALSFMWTKPVNTD